MMKKYLLPVFFFLLTVSCPSAMAAADSPILGVNVDHGVPLTLNTPATSVFIANPDIADVQVMSPTNIMVFGKRTGETTFMATDSSGNTLAQRTVVVTQDLYPLREELNAAMPGNHIQVQSLPNGLLMTGEAKDPASVADAYKIAQRYITAGGDIVNRVRVAGSNQIMIRVRFAEVSRTIDNTLGIDWDSVASIGGFAFGIASGNSFIDAAGAITRPNNTSLTEPNDVTSFGYHSSHANLNGLIDALARDGLVTVLAEPTLTAMSGETASFLAGGEIPVPIPQTSSGNNTVITVEWKQYGISLEFTPTLLSGDRINLHVKPEVSQLTNIGSITTDQITIPGLTTRKAETTVEVASGQSFAIAGMLDNNQSQTVDKYPLIGDLPILGALFRSNHFQNGQTELIVIITPYVVKPTDGQLALPMDGFSPPNETERLLGLRNSSSDPNARPMSGPPTARYVEKPSAANIPIPPMPASALGMPNTVAAQPQTPTAAPVTPVTAPVASMAPAPASLPQEAPVAAPAEEAVMTQAASAPPVPVKQHAAAPPSQTAAHGNPTSIAPAGPGGFVLE